MSKLLIAVAGVAAFAAAAQAQLYYTGFELPDFNASASGVPVTGQQGWYVPVVGSADGTVHTYSGNTYGFVQNPVGGNQFVVTAAQGGAAFARAQHDYPFGPGSYTVSWDMAPIFNGTPPSTLNLSSFSLNHHTLPAGQFRGFIALNNFTDLNNPAAGWKAEFNVFNAAGGAMSNQSPGPAWASLTNNHWYRQYVSFNLATNLIESIALVDLHTGSSSVANPQGWYLDGGAASTLAMPASVRLFGGGSTAGNVMAWDNVHIIPAPGALALLAGAGLAFSRRRR